MKATRPMKSLNNPLETMESRLESAFKPVHPSRDFVKIMRHRLELAPRVVVAERMRNPNQMILILGSVLSAMVVILTVGRALYYLTGRSASR